MPDPGTSLPKSGKAVGIAGAVLVLVLGLTHKWEDPRFYVAKRDVVGMPTVCDGHTGKDVIIGKRYTDADCDAFLKADIAEANATVHRCITVPMTVGQEAALTDAVFNIGPRVVCGSTLQARAMVGNWAAACAELDRWKYAGGRVYRGLVLRRKDDRAICEGRIDASSR